MKQIVLAALAALAAIPLFAASAGIVRGTVLAPDGRPLPGALVQLRNDITGFKAENATTTEGAFIVTSTPGGRTARAST